MRNKFIMMNVMKMYYLIILLLIMSLFVVGSVAASEDEELTVFDWAGHAIVSIIGFIFALLILITGAKLTGRIKKIDGLNSFNLHRAASILFSLFMVGTFFYGLLVTSGHETPLLSSSVHGWLGLLIVIFALLQVIPSVFIKKRNKIKFPHMMIGYSLVFLVMLQIIVGVQIAVLGDIKILVMAHSITGGITALALLWICIELKHLTNNGIKRIKIAGYVQVFFTIIGCWVVGGYNYLIDYGSKVKPVILSGSQPWAHQIIMETKEHIFIFLPILSILLAITLYIFGSDETLLNERRVKQGVILLTLLLLAMVLLMFIMGALISYAGNIGVEGV